MGVGVGGACVGAAVGVTAGGGVLLAGGGVVAIGVACTDPFWFPVLVDETGVSVA